VSQNLNRDMERFHVLLYLNLDMVQLCHLLILFGWRLLSFTSFYIIVHTIFFSTFELLSISFHSSIQIFLFFELSFSWLLGFNFGGSLQHFTFVWPSLSQWLQWFLESLHTCIMTIIFLFFHFPLFFSFFFSLLLDSPC